MEEGRQKSEVGSQKPEVRSRKSQATQAARIQVPAAFSFVQRTTDNGQLTTQYHRFRIKAGSRILPSKTPVVLVTNFTSTSGWRSSQSFTASSRYPSP